MAKVLLVEDERSILKALSFELEEDGFEVYHATNYQEAVSSLMAFECDLIISDLFIDSESGDGIRLLNEVLQNEKHIPFIAITAYPETNLAREAQKTLKDCFFIKPFAAGDLKKKVYELLGEKRPV
jgi:DNA-binding NtrC family response regulator